MLRIVLFLYLPLMHRIRISDIFSVSFMSKIKSNWPIIDPCGSPHVIVIYFEFALLYDIYYY